MSLQVFLQAQVFGSEPFLGVHSTQSGSSDSHSSDLIGRCAWLTLFCEVLPRALLAELKLSRMLLGSSSAEQFLLVLAEEEIPRANEFLTNAAAAVSQLSGGTLRLVWASTENLGAWPVARKRLDDALQSRVAAPLSAGADTARAFSPFDFASESSDAEHYFVRFAENVSTAKRIGWSAAEPARLTWDAGDHSWPLTDRSGDQSSAEDSILFPRRAAVDDSGAPATLSELASRAQGAQRWGILRGDVDHFDAHLRRANSIEEHIHLSVLFKEFFAGELSLLCTLPDFWRKVSILYRGGDDFAVAGAWDSLVLLARELERLFEKFIEQNAQTFPVSESLSGLGARTISMALSIAPETAAPISAVFLDAGVELRAAKSTDTGTFHLFGRTLEWKRLADAEELKAGLVRLVEDFKFSPDYINDLASVYREAFSARASRRGKNVKVDKPWRTYMRLTTIIPEARSKHGRGKELNNLRNAIITNLVGKRAAGLKLRPSARVGLEWARLAAGNPAA